MTDGVPALPDGDGAMRIGLRLRALRAERGLTIPTLAAQAGLSAGLISQIERGQSNPSMRTIQRLGATLGINLWAFIGQAEQDDTEALPFVRRLQDRPRMVVGPSRLVKELLSPSGDRDLRFMMVTLPAGSGTKDMLMGPGEKGGYVVSGQIELRVGERVAVLAMGDSFQFAGDQPHRLANPSQAEAVVLWIMNLREPSL